MSDSEDRRSHLNNIQSAIARMASASSNSKGWVLPVVTAAYGYAIVANSEQVALLGIGAALLFGSQDARYLRLERAFRALYRDAKDGSAEVFEMDPSPFFAQPNGDLAGDKHRSAEWKRIIWSWTIAGFYLPIVIVGIGILVATFG